MRFSVEITHKILKPHFSFFVFYGKVMTESKRKVRHIRTFAKSGPPTQTEEMSLVSLKNVEFVITYDIAEYLFLLKSFDNKRNPDRKLLTEKNLFIICKVFLIDSHDQIKSVNSI